MHNTCTSQHAHGHGHMDMHMDMDMDMDMDMHMHMHIHHAHAHAHVHAYDPHPDPQKQNSLLERCGEFQQMGWRGGYEQARGGDHVGRWGFLSHGGRVACDACVCLMPMTHMGCSTDYCTPAVLW